MCDCARDKTRSSYFPSLGDGEFAAKTLMIDREAAERLGYADEDGAVVPSFAAMAVQTGLATSTFNALGDRDEPVVLTDSEDDLNADDYPLPVPKQYARLFVPAQLRKRGPIVIDVTDDEVTDDEATESESEEADSEDDAHMQEAMRRFRALPPAPPSPLPIPSTQSTPAIGAIALSGAEDDSEATESDDDVPLPAPVPALAPVAAVRAPKQRVLEVVASEGNYGIAKGGKFRRLENGRWKSIRSQSNMPSAAMQQRLRDELARLKRANAARAAAKRAAAKEERARLKAAKTQRRAMEKAERRKRTKQARERAKMREAEESALQKKKQQIRKIVRSDENEKAARAERRHLFLSAIKAPGDEGMRLLSQYTPLDRIIAPPTRGHCRGRTVWGAYKSLGGGEQGMVCFGPRRNKDRVYADAKEADDGAIGCVIRETEAGGEEVFCPKDKSYTRKYVRPTDPCLECVPGIKEDHTNEDGCMVLPDGKTVVRPDEPLCRVHSVATGAKRGEVPTGPLLSENRVVTFSDESAINASQVDRSVAAEIGLDYDKLARRAGRFGLKWPRRVRAQ